MTRDYIKEINEATEMTTLLDIMSDIAKDIRNLYNDEEVLGNPRTLVDAHVLATEKAKTMMQPKKAE